SVRLNIFFIFVLIASTNDAITNNPTAR
ncbi:MAG: hypothetical protein RLZZ237_3679, partial [Pseudomonadota bacterium]